MNLVSRLKKLDHLTGQATYGMLLWLLRVLLLLHLVPSGFWLTGRAPLLRGLPPRPVCWGGLRARVAFASFTTGYAPLQVLRLGVLAPASSWQALPYPLLVLPRELINPNRASVVVEGKKVSEGKCWVNRGMMTAM